MYVQATPMPLPDVQLRTHVASEFLCAHVCPSYGLGTSWCCLMAASQAVCDGGMCFTVQQAI